MINKIETNRLILRPLEVADAGVFFKMDSNVNVHKYLWNKPVNNIQETLNVIDLVSKQYKEHQIGRFAVILKDTNQFMGWAGLKYNTEKINNKQFFYDIGYRLDEEFWGNGYATEASIAWLNYGFNEMNINIINAGAHADNLASNKILQKIGMTAVEQYLDDGVLWNWYTIKNKL